MGKSKISSAALEAMASSGNALARLCLVQRRELAELRTQLDVERLKHLNDSRAERVARDLQREIDGLRAENARLRSL